MSEQKERLSAYLDDALSKDELDALSELVLSEASGSSAEQNAEFSVASRYQLIGDALRGQLGDASMIDVSAQVREALREEMMPGEITDTSVDIDGKTDSRFGLWLNSWINPAWQRPLGGMAVAASVAMIMVAAVSNEGMTPDNTMVAEGSAAASAPVISMPVSTYEGEEAGINFTPVQQFSKRSSSFVNLDSYLAEHSEFAAQDTMQGMIPYARAVSYEAE